MRVDSEELKTLRSLDSERGVVRTVSRLDEQVHMQLQTLLFEQGIRTQLHATCIAERSQL